jgi:hypothetical protein
MTHTSTGLRVAAALLLAASLCACDRGDSAAKAATAPASQAVAARVREV